MPGPTTKITLREKAVLLMIAAGLVDDWQEAYFAAEDKSEKDARSIQYPKQQAWRWKRCHKVESTLQEFRKMFDDMKADARAEGREDGRRQKQMEIDEEIQKDRQTQGEEGKREGDNERPNDEGRARQKIPVDYSDPAERRKAYNTIIRATADDPKTQLDALKVFEQIQKDDRQAAKEGKQVRAYLPITCDVCPLYSKAKMKLKK